MQDDVTRTEMVRKPQGEMMLLTLVVLGCCALSLWNPLAPAAGWHLSVHVGHVHVSFGTAGGPVQNRTPLFEIGQVLARFNATR